MIDFDNTKNAVKLSIDEIVLHKLFWNCPNQLVLMLESQPIRPFYHIVMGICLIFEIDDCYTNIDWWSIICDNSLLNVFTEHNYSNRLYFKSMFHEVKIWLKLYHIFTNYNFSSANIVRTKQNTGFHICNTWYKMDYSGQ